MNRYCLLLSLLTPLIVNARNPDTNFSIKRVYTINSEVTPYSVSLMEHINQKFLTKRSTRSREFLVPEEYLGEIVHLSASINDKTLEKDEIVPQFEDVFYSALKVHRLVLPVNYPIGSEMWIALKKKYKDIAYLPYETIPNKPLLKEFVLEYHVPRGFDVEFEIRYARNEIPIQVKRQRGKVILSVTNVPFVKEIPYFPFNDVHAWIIPKITENGRDVSGSSPASFSSWYLSRMPASADLPADKYEKLRTELQQKSSSIAKLKTIHRYIQDHIRYMASYAKESSIFPRPPHQVMKSGFGDCKDRSLLFQEIARKEGLIVDLTLISTKPSPNFNSVKANMFDHMICSSVQEGRRIFFDPTNKYFVGEDLAQEEQGRRVLVLGEKAGWYHTPEEKEMRPSLELQVKLNIKNLEQAEIIAIVRKDIRAAILRAMEELTSVQVENLLSNAINAHFRKLSVDYFHLVDSQPDQLVFQAMGNFKDLLIKSKSKCYVPVAPFSFGTKELEVRSEDPYLLFLGEIDGMLEIEFTHEGYEFDRISKETPSLAPYAGISSEIGSNQKTKFQFHIHTPRVIELPKEKRSFLRFNKDYLHCKNVFYIFKGTEP